MNPQTLTLGLGVGRVAFPRMASLVRRLRIRYERFVRAVAGCSSGRSTLTPLRAANGYITAVVLVAATVVVRMGTDTWLGDSHPYTFFFVAITLTAWCCGLGPSILAIVLSYLAADWFFAAPRHAFDFQDFGKGDLVGLAGFFIAGLAIAFTSRALKMAKERAESRQQLLIREIGERKRVQRELEIAQLKLSDHAADLEYKVVQRTKALQQSLHSMEGLLYHVTHDLRGPLRGIRGLTQVLLDGYAVHFDQEGRDYADQILKSSESMEALIKDLLAYGRLGQMEVSLDTIHTERALDAALNLLATEISAKHAQIEIYRPLVPVIGNDTVLRQILLNLLSNALKYVRDGTNPRIQVWTSRVGDNVRLCVKDNGIGIAHKDHERIFNVFERLHTNEEYPGTGIGLAVVARGAERIGGRAGVESVLNQGSTFWIELPAVATTK